MHEILVGSDGCRGIVGERLAIVGKAKKSRDMSETRRHIVREADDDECSNLVRTDSFQNNPDFKEDDKIKHERRQVFISIQGASTRTMTVGTTGPYPGLDALPCSVLWKQPLMLNTNGEQMYSSRGGGIKAFY